MTTVNTPYTQHLIDPGKATALSIKKSSKTLVIKASKIYKVKEHPKANNRERGDVGGNGAEVGEMIEVVDDAR